MAYKFQLGSARLSGSIVLNEDLEVAGTTELAAGQIDANELASNAVTTVKILDANVTTAKIADSNVTTAKLANDAVTGAKIALGALDSEHYSTGSIESNHLFGAIADGKLAQDYIQVTEVDNSSIAWNSDNNQLYVKPSGITNDMLNGSIADGKLAQDYIQTSEVDNSSIEWDTNHLQVKALGIATSMLAADAVTSAKLADGAVSTSAKLADDVVVTSKIQDNAVTGAKIVADAVDSQHIALGALDSEHYSTGSIESNHLAGNIANAKLANSTISGIALGSNLSSLSAAADGAITFTSYNGSAAVSDVSVQVDGSTLAKASNALKIADGGVGSTQIANDAVTGAKIVADAVDSQHIALGALDSEHYSTGSIESNHLFGAIANAKLANSTVSYGGVQLSLGGSDATPAFNLTDASAYRGDISLVTVGALDAGSITSGFGSINVGSSAISTTGTGSFGKLVVSGDLEVSGDLTYVNTTHLAISDALITIGSGSSAFAAGHGIEFGAMEGGWASLKTATIGSDNVLSSSLGLAAPAVLANQFYGQLVGSFKMSVETLSSGDTMEVGKVYQVDNIPSAGSFSIAMPSGASAGDVVRVKCQAIASGEKLTLTGGFDGNVSQIYLESDYAAVMFIYDGAEWMVF